MRRWIVLLMLLTASVTINAQYTNWLNVKSAPFNAVGNGIADDYAALQAALDSAVKVNATVYIPKGTYSISAPLIVYRWSGTQYQQSYINIVGDDEMFSTGISVIAPTFKNTFALGLHLNKGTTVTGITFDGQYDMSAHSVDSLYKSPFAYVADSTCRDSRYSPYSAIVVDPFRGVAPADGGYPGLTSYYRGSDVTSGSTGLIFNDINISGFVIGAIISPNGLTLNGELMTFENVKVNDCKIAFAGCQAQEKGNRIINWALTSKVRVGFVWDTYGQAQPGHYIIDGVSLEYGVCDFLFRQSAGYFPLYVMNVVARDIGRIGEWSTGVNDALVNSSFDFIYYDTTGNKSYIAPHLTGGQGITMMNVSMRYAGHPEIPVILASNLKQIYNVGGDSATTNQVMGLYLSTASSWMYRYGYSNTLFTTAAINWYNDGGIRRALIADNVPPSIGDRMIICATGSDAVIGTAVVTAVTASTNYTISYIAPSVVNGTTYRIHKYFDNVTADWKPNNTNGNANVYDTTINGGSGEIIRLFKNVRRN